MTKHERRRLRMQEHGCIACFKFGIPGQPPDMHHLNFDNKAGGKRLGVNIVIPLCPWHHRGIRFDGYSNEKMMANYGPSRELHKRAFVMTFGTDDALLTEVDDRIRQMEELARGAA